MRLTSDTHLRLLTIRPLHLQTRCHGEEQKRAGNEEKEKYKTDQMAANEIEISSDNARGRSRSLLLGRFPMLRASYARTMGTTTLKTTQRAKGHSLVRSLVHSHRSVRFALLRSFVRLLAPELTGKRLIC